MCDWWFNVDCSLSESLYFLNIEVAEKNAERQRQREQEREEAKEEERQRKELTADEINDLRAGGEEETREQPRRSNSLGGRPAVSRNQFSQIKSRPTNSRRPKSKATSAPRVANRFNGFGRLRKSKSSASTTTATSSGRVKTTINLRNTQTQTNPVRNNFRQSVKSASKNEGRKKKKKKSRLRKAKNPNNNSQGSSRFKTKPFTNFGNGQSRFGNF